MISNQFLSRLNHQELITGPRMRLLFVFLFWLAPRLAVAESSKAVDLQFAFKGDPGKVTDVLELDPKSGKRRQVYLLDTLNLDLFHRNIQIRLRINKDRSQIAVKTWGLSASQFDSLNSLLGHCEVDVHGPVMVRSCAVKNVIPLDEAQLIVGGQSVLRSMSERQLLLLTNTQVPFDLLENLVALGPLESTTWSWEDDGDKFNVDFQTTPDNRLFRELSVKTTSEDFLEQWMTVQQDLKQKGLRLARRQNGRRLEKLTSLLICAHALTF